MTYTMASSAAIIMEAGASISSSVSSSDALLARFSNNAEGIIYANTRYDFIAKYPNASSGAQFFLSATAAKLAAIDMIKYDFSGFPLTREAEDRINILNFQTQQNLKLLSEDKNRKFIIDGTTGVS